MVNFNKLRGAMAERAVTQTALAERLGYTRQSVSNKFAGKTQLTLNDVTVISDALGLTVAERDEIFFA